MNELPGALHRTAALLSKYRLSHLTVAPGRGGLACLSVTVEAEPDASEALARAMAGSGRTPVRGSGAPPTGAGVARTPAPLVQPFHWQADGAGDDRAG
jgi:hypothetical protein